MIDTLEQIKPLLVFDSEDDFYFLQILQRKKENELLTANSHVIKNYYITSLDHLDIVYEEIIKLCKMFNARASLRLNRRSFKQLAFQNLKKVTDTILNQDYKSVRKSYDRSCDQFQNEDNRKWILDIDTNDISIVERAIAAVKFCDPDQGTDKHIITLKTKSGYHVITSPFNQEQFKLSSRLDIDIHKDNPINLYIP